MNQIPKLFILVFLIACGTSKEVKRDRFFLQGNNALEQNEYDQARDFYTKAITADPTFARAYNNRGVTQIEDGHPYEAIQDYNQAIAIAPDYADALFNRAYAYEQVGRIDDALVDITYVKTMFPDSAYVYFYEGILQANKKAFDAGIQAFEKALQLDSSNPETKVNLATLKFYNGEISDAKNLLEEVLQINPQDANALNTLSQIALDQSQLEEALDLINNALDIVPNEPYFVNNRGQIYLAMDSLGLAVDDINRSILINPKNAWAYRNKGLYYAKNGKFEDAVRLYKEAIQQNEFIDEVYVYLGQAHLELGNQDEACAAWGRGVEVNELNAQQLLNQYCN